MRNKVNTQEIIQKFFSSAPARKALMIGSRNRRELAEKRVREYERMLRNIVSHYSATNFFSVNAGTGLSYFPHLGTTVSVAALTALVRSVAPFLTLEKAIDQPNTTLYFLDLLSTSGANAARFPVVGPFDYSGNPFSLTRGQTSISVTSSNTYIFQVGPGYTPGWSGTTYSIDTNTLVSAGAQQPAILPRSFKLIVKFVDNSGSVSQLELIDNGNGSFLIPSSALNSASVLSVSVSSTSPSISYGNANTANPQPFTARVDITLNTSSNGTLYFEWSWTYAASEAVTYPLPGNETRLRLDLKRTIVVNTRPNSLVAEIDLFAIDTMRKTMDVDVVELLTERITDIINDLMNRYIAFAYLNMMSSTPPVTIDVRTPLGQPTATMSSFNAYNPILDRIMGELEGVNHFLAKRSFIGLTANAYFVSSRMAYWLSRTGLIDPANFVREDSRFINGLVGYYRGVPVIVNVALDPVFDTTITDNNETYYTAGGFAVHNMPESDLSPAVYATFLPVTATPTVGNFNNPTQQVIGLYHQAEVTPLAPELAVPFRFIGLPPVTV